MAATQWTRVVTVDRQTGVVSLQTELVLSDVQAFVKAATRALDPRVGPAEHLAAAEEALSVELPLLGDEDPQVLPRDLPEHHNGGVVSYEWARQDTRDQEAPAYLVALWQKAALVLARAHSDAGQHAAAAHLYATLLDRDPLHSNAREGLLLAAARSGEPSELDAAWSRIRTAWGARFRWSSMSCTNGWSKKWAVHVARSADWRLPCESWSQPVRPMPA